MPAPSSEVVVVGSAAVARLAGPSGRTIDLCGRLAELAIFEDLLDGVGLDARIV